MDHGSSEPKPDPSSEPDEVAILLSRIETHGLTPSQALSPRSGSTPSHGLWQPPTPEELEKQVPPQYKVLDLVGRGGMGAVYRGWQSSLERYVAIKILPMGAAPEESRFRDRFKQEARTMAKFQHPAIVSIYDAGETTTGLLYIVMEFIEGTDVALMVRSQGRLPPEYALAISAHVCDALQYAHTHGVVHRDIKPANVMLNQEGAVKVADFGLARGTDHNQRGLTKSDMAVGTPDYVAPEAMILGIKTDHRADLYAVGVMLYEMLTGRVPRGMFELPSALAGTDERFDSIVAKAMDPDRDKRYQTAQEIRYDLDVILSTPKLEEHGPSSSAIPKQELAVVQRQMIAKKPVARRAGMTKPVHEVISVTYAPEPAPEKKKKSSLPAMIGLAVLAVGGYFGWQQYAAHSPPTAAASVPESANTSAASATSTSSVTPAPPGSLLFNGHRYKFVPGEMNWKDSNEQAILMGGHLATLTTESEDFWVRKTFVDPLPESHLLFIGGIKDAGIDSIFCWSNGEPWSYEHWPQGIKPKKTANPQGLTYVNYPLGRADGWIAAWSPTDKPGDRIEGFLVEWDTDQVETPKIATKPAPVDALPFGGHRYKLIPSDGGSWTEARDQASAMGGHLATLTTPEENEWVRHTFAENLPMEKLFFIGGFKPIGETSEWEWVTGEPWSFKDWEKNRKPHTDAQARGATFMNIAGGSTSWQANWNASLKVSRSVGFLVEWDTDQVETPKISNQPTPVAYASQPDAEPIAIAPVDLLDGVDVKRDASSFRWDKWELIPEGLAGHGLVLFNQAAPDEYDFETEFTFTTGFREIELVLPLPMHAILWRMGHGAATEDPTFFGFGPFLDTSGLHFKEYGKPNAMLPRLKLGQRYHCVIEVRKRSVRALLDGHEMVSWSGDIELFRIKGFSDELVAKVKDSRHPGFYVNSSEVSIHKADLRPKGAIVDKLAEFESQFKDAYERDVTRGAAGQALAALDVKYLAALDNAIADAAKNGRMEDVTALRQEKQRMADKGPLPAADPVNIVVSLGKLRDIYRKAVVPLLNQREAAAEPVYVRYDEALAAFQTELAGRGEALAIQGLREALEAKRHLAAAQPEIAAATPSSKSLLATAPTQPVETMPKKPSNPKKLPTLPPEMLQEPVPKPFAPEQAIEWAVSLGGSAKIKRGTQDSEITSMARMPKGSFTLISLSIGAQQPLHVVSLAALSQLSDLQELILDDNLITDAGLAFLPKLPKLTHLSLKGCFITDAGLPLLAKQSALTSLGLGFNSIDGSGLRELAGLQDITTLDLRNARFFDDTLPILTVFTSLTSLNLSGNSPPTVTTLEPLAKLKELKLLILGKSATDQIVPSLESLTQLSVLDLDNSPITDAALEHIGSMKGLRELNLSGCHNLTDLGLAKLGPLKGLTKLNVEHTRLTNSQFIELSKKLSELVELDLASDAMTDQGLAGLMNLHKLIRLHVHARTRDSLT